MKTNMHYYANDKAEKRHTIESTSEAERYQSAGQDLLLKLATLLLFLALCVSYGQQAQAANDDELSVVQATSSTMLDRAQSKQVVASVTAALLTNVKNNSRLQKLVLNQISGFRLGAALYRDDEISFDGIAPTIQVDRNDSDHMIGAHLMFKASQAVRVGLGRASSTVKHAQADFYSAQIEYSFRK